jgi:hypothetical protein
MLLNFLLANPSCLRILVQKFGTVGSESQGSSPD